MSVNLSPILVYVGFFIITGAFSVVINGLFLKFSRNLGMRNESGQNLVRWGSTSKPALGGISFYIIFLFSILAWSIFVEPNYNEKFYGLLIASSVGFMIGLADDAYNTRPLLKFLGQVVCALTLITTGNVIELVDIAWVNYLLTILWVVGLMNSINMLDNMDAITASVSISVLLGAIALNFMFADHFSDFDLIIPLCVLAAILGFLYFNWHPSKIYMGDTGSQFLGVYLAAIGIKYFWNVPVAETAGSLAILPKLMIPMALFVVPIVDTTTVVINRLMRGQSPFVGGRDHTTHHLSYLGLTDRQVALVVLILSLVPIALMYFTLSGDGSSVSTYLIIIGAYFVSVFAFLFGVTKYSKPKR